MKHTQLVDGIRVFTRHNKDCKFKQDRSYIKCNCRKWLQYQQGGETIKESANTRSWDGLQKAAEKKAAELRGEAPIKIDVKTIESAVGDWLAFRVTENNGNKKAQMMGNKFVVWCKERKIIYLKEITTNLTTQFFMAASEIYSNGNSSSLKIHWSMIKAFFRWVTEEQLVDRNPLARRKITFRKPEVVVPTKQEIQRVIDMAEGLDKLFVLTQRYTGMAIHDTSILSKIKLTGCVIQGNRQKTNERYRVRIPQWLANALAALPGEYMFWNGITDPESLVQNWQKRLRQLFEAGGVRMTSHKFRHFFISEQLSMGIAPADVSDMVGTSEAVIRKTYKHDVKDGMDRLDALQSQVWMQQGLDASGNQIIQSVQ
jgi:integrase